MISPGSRGGGVAELADGIVVEVPAGDLALQNSVGLAFGLPARPSPAELAAMAEKWSPWRGVAARLFWAYYRAVKNREAVPV